MVGAAGSPALRVRLLCWMSWPMWALGRGDAVPATMLEAEASARTLDDPATLGFALYHRAAFASCAGKGDVASPLADEALACASASRDPWLIAMATWARALACSDPGELPGRVEAAATVLEQAGNLYHLADVFHVAGEQSLCWGRDHDALRYLARATPLVRAIDQPYLWMLLREKAGHAALFTGDTEAARDALSEALRLSRELGVPPVASEGLFGLAAVATVENDADRAARLAGAGGAHRRGDDGGAMDRLRATFLQPARARFGADAWDTAAAAGAALDLDDAIAYALDEGGDAATASAERPRRRHVAGTRAR
jgi:hypothetical protein